MIVEIRKKSHFVTHEIFLHIICTRVLHTFNTNYISTTLHFLQSLLKPGQFPSQYQPLITGLPQKLFQARNQANFLRVNVIDFTVVDLSERVSNAVVGQESLALGRSEGGDGQNDNQSNKSLEVHFYWRCSYLFSKFVCF